MQYSSDLIYDANPDCAEEFTGLDPDVNNPLYDVLVQDEEFQAAGKRTYDDLERMMSRLSGIDEAHPAFEPLVEVVNSKVLLYQDGKPAFDDMAKSSFYKYRRGLQAVDELNEHTFLPVFLWVAAAAGVATSAVTGVPVGSMVAGACVGNGLGRTGMQIRDTRRALDEYLQFASEVHACRDEFDTMYAKLVSDEDAASEDLSQSEV